MKLIFFFISKPYKLKAQIPGSLNIKLILMLLIGPKTCPFLLVKILKKQLNPTCFDHMFLSISVGPSKIKIGPMCFFKNISHFSKGHLTISGLHPFFLPVLLTIMSSSYLLLFANGFPSLIFWWNLHTFTFYFPLSLRDLSTIHPSKTRRKN